MRWYEKLHELLKYQINLQRISYLHFKIESSRYLISFSFVILRIAVEILEKQKNWWAIYLAGNSRILKKTSLKFFSIFRYWELMILCNHFCAADEIPTWLQVGLIYRFTWLFGRWFWSWRKMLESWYIGFIYGFPLVFPVWQCVTFVFVQYSYS